MMSPKWDDPDPGFVAMSQAFTLNPYRDTTFVPQRLMSPPITFPAPLSPCLCAEPKPDSAPEPEADELAPEHEVEGESGHGEEHEPEHETDHESEHESDHKSDHEHEPELDPEPEHSAPQEIKHEIAWSTIEAGLQGFTSVRPSTSSSSNGYIDEYGCAQFSDTVDTVDTIGPIETIQSFPYPFNTADNSQSHLPMVGDIMGSDGHITTQFAGKTGTAGYFSVFPTAYQPRPYQAQPYTPPYVDDYFGSPTSATSATASYGPSLDGPNYGAASYGTSSYGNAYGSNAYGNAYANAYSSNPYSTTAYGLSSNQGMGSQMGMAYRQYNPYGEASQMPIAASMPASTSTMSAPTSTLPNLTVTTPTRSSTVSNGPVTPDCSLHHLHPSKQVLPGPPLKGDRSGTAFYRYVTPPFHTTGAPHYVLGEEPPTTSAVARRQSAHARGLSSDSDSGRSRSSRLSSSSSSGASTVGYNRQNVLDSIPLHKLLAMQKIPLPPDGDNLAKDRYIVRGKQLKLSYGQIKAIAGWRDAESTLRGRYRNFTKAKHERVRKPVWHEIDKRLLIKVVMKYARDSLNRMPAGGRNGITGHHPGMRYTVQTLPEGTEAYIPWRDVAKRMVAWGGTYEFGASTTKRKWFELTRRKRSF
ncbi:Hypothetical protein PENO1_097080 [Penicillium occitanis (nom. inval.)]|nr:Hypothetical protein PENO1_097080 [Penicillium occitanis (nom. inval.)]PCG92363.1 hypothetical protein PENOC_092920 [Penicillium occitanis (nom. inval.)]